MENPRKMNEKVIEKSMKIQWKIVQNRAWKRVGPSWGLLGCLLSVLGRLGCILGASWERLGPSWERPGGILEPAGDRTWTPGRAQNRSKINPKSHWFVDRFLVDFGSFLGSMWGPLRAPGTTGTPPRRSKTLPRRSQDAPKTLKDANKAPQEAPRGPKTPPSSILDDFSLNFHRFFIDCFIDFSWIFHRFFIDVLMCWDYSGSILEVLWKYSGNILGLFWEYSGSILGVFWQYLGIILGVFWECSGKNRRAFRHRGLTWKICGHSAVEF